jgi:hypothetical protein
MDELRVVRREDRALIVADEAGTEYRLLVDSSTLSDLRQLARQLSDGPKVSPRQIQALVRAGKTRAEITELTGAEDSDIDRYEEPVLAERRFILSTAQSVPVRTSPSDQDDQKFGTVISERLIGLNAQNVTWVAWRDEEAGWMIGLDFDSYDVSHHAVWGFNHRKSVLSPLSPDAVNLSKQGDVGERLIPKLRAVDAENVTGRFESGAFDHKTLSAEGDPTPPENDPASGEDASARTPSPAAEAALRAGHPSTGSIPIIEDPDAEFVRRREIDMRAIKTSETQEIDLGQTADLLDALRKRRDDRDTPPTHPLPVEEPDAAPVRDIRGHDAAPAHAVPAPKNEAANTLQEPAEQSPPDRDSEPPATDPGKRKGRTSIPSWDDILFGTRSEEDPV